jgi:hypothetical protein
MVRQIKLGETFEQPKHEVGRRTSREDDRSLLETDRKQAVFDTPRHIYWYAVRPKYAFQSSTKFRSLFTSHLFLLHTLLLLKEDTSLVPKAFYAASAPFPWSTLHTSRERRDQTRFARLTRKTNS